jgi:hypothetical protein
VTDVVPVEYLYSPWMYEDERGHLDTEVKLFRITKRTPKRVFFDAGRGRAKSVDREQLEREGRVWVREFGGYSVYANRADAEPTPREATEDKIRRLRVEAAALHPDRGGDPIEFRAAYARYQRAAATRAEAS